ncbi:hypothetical protein, partial [Pseudomonas aeruginosa]|uniref:hypothetical protein n=1 Tax=Pseudomonas aeruginosa TaxID=287 RepID=UPI001E3D3C2E
CARLKTYGALFGDKNHKAFSRFCLCGHEKSGLAVQQYLSGESHLYALAGIPYALLYVHDALSTPLVLPPAQRRAAR